MACGMLVKGARIINNVRENLAKIIRREILLKTTAMAHYIVEVFLSIISAKVYITSRI